MRRARFMGGTELFRRGVGVGVCCVSGVGVEEVGGERVEVRGEWWWSVKADLSCSGLCMLHVKSIHNKLPTQKEQGSLWYCDWGAELEIERSLVPIWSKATLEILSRGRFTTRSSTKGQSFWFYVVWKVKNTKAYTSIKVYE